MNQLNLIELHQDLHLLSQGKVLKHDVNGKISFQRVAPNSEPLYLLSVERPYLGVIIDRIKGQCSAMG